MKWQGAVLIADDRDTKALARRHQRAGMAAIVQNEGNARPMCGHKDLESLDAEFALPRATKRVPNYRPEELGLAIFRLVVQHGSRLPFRPAHESPQDLCGRDKGFKKDGGAASSEEIRDRRTDIA